MTEDEKLTQLLADHADALRGVSQAEALVRAAKQALREHFTTPAPVPEYTVSPLVPTVGQLLATRGRNPRPEQPKPKPLKNYVTFGGKRFQTPWSRPDIIARIKEDAAKPGSAFRGEFDSRMVQRLFALEVSDATKVYGVTLADLKSIVVGRMTQGLCDHEVRGNLVRVRAGVYRLPKPGDKFTLDDDENAA